MASLEYIKNIKPLIERMSESFEFLFFELFIKNISIDYLFEVTALL
jgi:hypothetical protein